MKQPGSIHTLQFYFGVSSCSRALQIVKTTQIFWHSQVFGPLKFHEQQNWPVSGRLRNPIPKTETQFLDLLEYFTSFWTLNVSEIRFQTSNVLGFGAFIKPASFVSFSKLEKISVLQGLSL